MFIKKVFLIAFIATVFSSCCYADNKSYDNQKDDIYIIVGVDLEEKKDLIMLLLESITTSNTDPQIKYCWSVVVNKNKTLPYDTEKSMIKGNCVERKITILTHYKYLKNKVVSSYTKPFEMYCPPSSYGDDLLNIVCSPNKLTILNNFKKKHTGFIKKS